MGQIAPVSNERCVHRGISIMRLALGYEAGLPDNWWFKPDGGRDSPNGLADEIRQIKQAFPKHKAIVFCNPFYNALWRHYGLQRDEYMSLDTLRLSYDILADKALFAFAYIHDEGRRTHFVVGNPVGDESTLYSLMVYPAT